MSKYARVLRLLHDTQLSIEELEAERKEEQRRKARAKENARRRAERNAQKRLRKAREHGCFGCPYLSGEGWCTAPRPCSTAGVD